ncbi:MAG: hypothetical protein IKP95_05645 [Ruminococcus sp.]|nr:hypothetical protein [Ruminococcus sp.]
MDLILPFLAGLGLIGIKRTKSLDDCLNIRQTQAVNGFFVVIIFIRHFYQYITQSKYDRILGHINSSTGQLIVVSFMFFSGFAFVRQYNISEKYLSKVPKKIVALYLMFVITVILFMTVGIASGRSYGIKTVLLSFVGIRSVGNSTWYVVAILFMWAFSYVSFKQKMIPPLILMTALTTVYFVVMMHFMGDIYYNTVAAYLLGMVCASYNDRVIACISQNKMFYPLLTGVCGSMALGGFFKRLLPVYELCIIAFCVFLLLFSIKFQVDNKVLRFLNSYSLEIYLIQRIPMILLRNVTTVNLIYFILSFALTIPMAFIMKMIYHLICKLLSLTTSKSQTEEQFLPFNNAK